jgi:hypothetical protein
MLHKLSNIDPLLWIPDTPTTIEIPTKLINSKHGLETILALNRWKKRKGSTIDHAAIKMYALAPVDCLSPGTQIFIGVRHDQLDADEILD